MIDDLPPDKRDRVREILDGPLPYEQAVEAIWQIAPELGRATIEALVHIERFGDLADGRR